MFGWRYSFILFLQEVFMSRILHALRLGLMACLLVGLMLCLALAFPSMAMGQRQCVLTDVDEDGTPTKGRCEERPQGKGDDSDTWWAVAAGVVVVGGVSAYVLWEDDQEVLLRLHRYNAWMREHTETDERGISFKLFEW